MSRKLNRYNHNDVSLSWLAGLLDGEGSIGIGLVFKRHRPNSPYKLSPAVQMNITEKSAIDESARILTEIGIAHSIYTGQEKKPTTQRDVWVLKVGRTSEIYKLCGLMAKYSVIKKRQWLLMLEYTASRLSGTDLSCEDLRKRAGGRSRYSTREVEIAKELRTLNLRGAQAIARDAEWRRIADNLRR